MTSPLGRKPGGEGRRKRSRVVNDPALVAEVAKDKYLSKLTIDEIAKMRGVSRSSVIRMLERAWNEELINITIRAPDEQGKRNKEEERKLLHAIHFKYPRTSVVQTYVVHVPGIDDGDAGSSYDPKRSDEIHAALGSALASSILDSGAFFFSGATIAVGSGRGPQCIVAGLDVGRPLCSSATIVSLAGSAGVSSHGHRAALFDADDTAGNLQRLMTRGEVVRAYTPIAQISPKDADDRRKTIWHQFMPKHSASVKAINVCFLGVGSLAGTRHVLRTLMEEGDKAEFRDALTEREEFRTVRGLLVDLKSKLERHKSDFGLSPYELIGDFNNRLVWAGGPLLRHITENKVALSENPPDELGSIISKIDKHLVVADVGMFDGALLVVSAGGTEKLAMLLAIIHASGIDSSVPGREEYNMLPRITHLCVNESVARKIREAL